MGRHGFVVLALAVIALAHVSGRYSVCTAAAEKSATVPLGSLCAMAAPAPKGEPASGEPPLPLNKDEAPKNTEHKFEGYLDSSKLLGKTGSDCALFLDSSRSALEPPESEELRAIADQVLRSVAAYSDRLANSAVLAFRFNKETGNHVQGKSAAEMLHVVAFPRSSIRVTGRAKDPTRFSPGPVTALEQLSKRFGPPSEKELWLGEGPRSIGLQGEVLWWGHVGVAVSEDGIISHLLLRAPTRPVDKQEFPLLISWKTGPTRTGKARDARDVAYVWLSPWQCVATAHLVYEFDYASTEGGKSELKTMRIGQVLPLTLRQEGVIPADRWAFGLELWRAFFGAKFTGEGKLRMAFLKPGSPLDTEQISNWLEMPFKPSD